MIKINTWCSSLYIEKQPDPKTAMNSDMYSLKQKYKELHSKEKLKLSEPLFHSHKRSFLNRTVPTPPPLFYGKESEKNYNDTIRDQQSLYQKAFRSPETVSDSIDINHSLEKTHHVDSGEYQTYMSQKLDQSPTNKNDKNKIDDISATKVSGLKS